MKKLKHFLACAAMAVGLALCGMAGSGAAGVGMPVMAAETPDLSGTAYAVWDSDWTLWFVRSTETHENMSTGTVTSISGGKYTGLIFAGFEEQKGFGYNSYWQTRVLKKVVFIDDIMPLTTARWFYGKDKITEIDGIDKLIMRNVTSMSEMFYNCSTLTSLDLSGWDTSKVTDIDDMFYSCKNLKELNISGWDLSKC